MCPGQDVHLIEGAHVDGEDIWLQTRAAVVPTDDGHIEGEHVDF